MLARQRTALEGRLKQIEFVRHAVAPSIRRAQRAWLKRRSLPLTCIDDLGTVAPTRGWTYATALPLVYQTNYPSHGLPEDVLRIVTHARRLASKHVRRRSGLEHIYRMWFANLLSVSRYPVDETFTCEIPDAWIVVESMGHLSSAANGVVVTSDFEAIAQSGFRGIVEELIVRSAPDADQRLGGTYVPLLGRSDHDYGHWLIDVLPRVMLVWERRQDLLYAVPAGLQSFKAQALALLGIAPEQLVPLERGWHRLERVVVCQHAQRSIIPKTQHIADLRLRLTEAAAGALPRPTPWRRVYVSRARSRRKIANEQDVWAVLQDHGFERYFCEEMSFADQVRLFSEASAIAGPHGAGLNNSILCQPGAKVIELYNPVRWNYCVRGAANAGGHEHWFMFGENLNRAHDMRVDPSKLDKLLAYAFDRGDAVEAEW